MHHAKDWKKMFSPSESYIQNIIYIIIATLSIHGRARRKENMIVSPETKKL